MTACANIDELRLYRGADFLLPNGVVIKSPTLGGICDYGEKDYLSMVSIFTATAIDRCAQLDDMGIDYTEISNFEMFMIFAGMLAPDENKENTMSTRILFGDLDFSQFKIVKVNDKLCMLNSDGIMFSDSDYAIMASYIRKMHGMSEPLYTHVKNEFAKQQLIIDARNDADFQRKMKAIKGEHSNYQPLISALVNHPAFKFDWKTVWDMTVYAFFDSLKRISIIDNANHLYQGLYSGCIEYNKIKKDLDWLKPIN